VKGCSKSNIHREFKVMGVFAVVRRRGPVLSDSHKSQRVEYCRWALRNVCKVKVLCFSDETWITSNPAKGRFWQWLRKGEFPDSIGTDSHPMKVCFWIAIGKGFKCLVVLDCSDGRNMTKQRYETMLSEQNKLWKILRKEKIPFQEDRHPIHKAEEWLRQHHVPLPDKQWPEKGPDLSPVETVNQWLKLAISKRGPWGVEEITKVAKEEFEKIEQSRIDRLVDTFHDRCKLCIEAKGGLVKAKRRDRS